MTFFWQFLLLQKIFKRWWDVCFCFWGSPIFHVVSQTSCSVPAQQSTQAICILLYSHGRTHVPVWEPACTGILLHISACFYLTYSQSPFPLLHLKSRLLYGTRMLSEQWSYFAGNRSSTAFHADEKETGEKHVVFRCNPLTLCQNSNVQFPSKKQRICVKNTVMFKVPPCSQNLKTQHLKPSLFLTERF